MFRLRDAWLVVVALLIVVNPALAKVPGIAAGIPQPAKRNVIVQLFNWRFPEITAAMPQLAECGYSHIHVSPPQKSNEQVWQWWGRYQPIDFGKIEGPLGDEQAFKLMCQTAAEHDIQIIVDVVLNHTIDVTEMPTHDFVVFSGNEIVEERFPQFEPTDFRPRCNVHGGDAHNDRTCWLSNNLCELKTDSDRVRDVAKEYLKKLVGLGASGFRFDATKHIEPEFFPAILQVTPNAYAFGEIIAGHPDDMNDYLAFEPLDLYDFPLVATMREAFFLGGDLRRLKTAHRDKRALPGTRAITFIRNHDIERGQASDRGIEDASGRSHWGVGWSEERQALDRKDVYLAHAFIMGRQEGLPYVFVDMPTVRPQDDRFDDPNLTPGIRFHNLCLDKSETWILETPNAIGLRRGEDALMVINKAAEPFRLRNYPSGMQSGEYREIATGWRLDVQPDGTIREWVVPGRMAVMFVRPE
jgi:alpha-amylase